jgi:O-antigen/teichoic acid export membrane protein
VIGYVSLFYVITDFGSQSIAVRDMARNPELSAVIAGRLLTFRLVLAAVNWIAAVLIALLVPLSSFHAPGIEPAIAVAALALLSGAVVSASGAVFQVKVRMGVPAIAEVAARAISVGLIALIAADLLFGSKANVATKLVAVVTVSTIASAFAAFISFSGARRLMKLRPEFDFSRSTPMIRDALPLAVVLILGIVHYRIDVVILSVMKGMSTVGLYGVATKLLDVALAGSAVFLGLTFPVLSERAAGDPELLQRAFQKAFDLILIVGIGAAVFACLLAPSLVRILAGSQFRGASDPVAVIAWAIPITFLNTLFAHMVIVGNRQRKAVPIVLLAIVLNILLNILLIPRMGATAPALVTDITEGLSMLGTAFIMVQHFHFSPSFGSIARIVLSGAIAALILVALRAESTAVAAALAVVAYVVALFLTRAVTADDLRATFQPQAVL